MLNIIQRVASRYATAVAKKDTTKAIAELMRKSPYTDYLKVKSARAGKIIIEVDEGYINQNVKYVSLYDLNKEQGKYEVFLDTGESGWDWDVFKKPPKFHNTPGGNIIPVQSFGNPESEPEKFAKALEHHFFKVMVPSIQKAGYVRDETRGRILRFKEWQRLNEEALAVTKSLTKLFKEESDRAAKTLTSLGFEGVTSRWIEYSGGWSIYCTVGSEVEGHWLTFETKMYAPDKEGKYLILVQLAGEMVGSRSYSRVPPEEIPKALAQNVTKMIDLCTKMGTKNPPKLEQPEPYEEAWSVVVLDRDGYATSVDTFDTKKQAEEHAKEQGDCYVVKGTQYWNKTLGRVEEGYRDPPTRYYP